MKGREGQALRAALGRPRKAKKHVDHARALHLFQALTRPSGTVHAHQDFWFDIAKMLANGERSLSIQGTPSLSERVYRAGLSGLEALVIVAREAGYSSPAQAWEYLNRSHCPGLPTRSSARTVR
jgi:hypothetical protein